MTDVLNRKSCAELTPEEVEQQVKIRELNDKLRHNRYPTAPGHKMIVLTGALAQMDGPLRTAAVINAAGFDAFSEDNNPQGEHDFGQLTILAEQIMFKLDCYYDLDLKTSSEEPSNPEMTRRVMSLFLASDY